MKSFYICVKALIEHNNKILLLKRSSKVTHAQYFWDVPGGRIDGDEQIEQTLKRELAEEIGYTGSFEIEKLVHVFQVPFDVENGHGLLLVYYAVKADVTEITLSEEHESFIWVAKDEMQIFMEQEAKYIVRGGTNIAIEKMLSKE